MHHQYVVLLENQFHFLKDTMYSVSTYDKEQKINLRKIKRWIWRSLCYFVRHHQNIVHLCLQFYCLRYAIRSVPFFVKREQIYEWDKKRRIVTVLFRITWARCCAPEAVILLENRFNIVSVYVCRQIWEYKIKRKHWWSHRIIP